ncbi:hypothetical protein LIER_20444 [Lithospermum erythrorhizon]|uniref:BHLH domain-containing protein n=1 Tax=Lithospermum erythrorhizon TaxID=34254 RepID=A0AAV3QPY7_LITER
MLRSSNSSESDDQVLMHFQDHHELPFLLRTIIDYNISEEPVDCYVMDNVMVPAFSNDASQDSNIIIDVDNGVDVKENIFKRKSDETILVVEDNNNNISDGKGGQEMIMKSPTSSTMLSEEESTKRRERMNERLRIISTMLEEAVQYVNFLQLQI